MAKDPKRQKAGRKSHATRQVRAEIRRHRELARTAMIDGLAELEHGQPANAVVLMAIATIQLTRDIGVIREVERIALNIRKDAAA